MENQQNIRAIYVNFPVHDLIKTRAFWEKLGFGFNEGFSDENALCLILKEGSIYAMLIQRDKFQTFTDRPVADASTTQVLVAVDVGSRERVKEIMERALTNGAQHYLKAEDHGWMYYDRFIDPDGHQWEISFMDASAMPSN